MRRDIRRAAAGLLTLALLASGGVAAGAPRSITGVEQRITAGAQADALSVVAFTDIGGNPYRHEITWIASVGISTGWPDLTYRPYASVNRDAMAAFLYRLAGSPAYAPPAVSPFNDIHAGIQFYKEMAWLADAGISTGYDDGGYHPFEPVNRDAMAAFLYRLVGSPEFTAPEESPFVDVTPETAFYKEMAWLASTGVSTGWSDGTFRPVTSINRDAMAAFMYRLGGSWPTRTLSGSGPATVRLPTLGARYWTAHVTHTTGDPNGAFEVWTTDGGKQLIGPIVGVSGPYAGTVGLTSFFDGRKDVSYLNILAAGAWTVDVRAVETAPAYDGVTPLSGTGDAVVRVNQVAGSTIRLHHPEDGTFIVMQMTRDGSWRSTPVETYGPFSATRTIPGDIYALEIISDGAWSITR